MKTSLSIVRCADYDQARVEAAVRSCLDLLGGIKSFVPRAARVLVKPNILIGKDPECGVTTHPQVVAAVVRVLKENGCKVFVGDSPSVWGRYIGNVDEVYELSGIAGVCRAENVALVKFDKKRWRGRFPLTTWLDDCDCFVNLPKFKTHGLTLMTAAIKNLFGLVCGTYKTQLHKDNYDEDVFAKMLVDLYEQAPPALSIVDGIVAMEGDGPGTSGKLRNTGFLVAGKDCVAIDSVLARVMGLKPFDVLTTKEAASRGLGTADLNSIFIAGEKLDSVTGKPFMLPRSSLRTKIPRPVINLALKLLRYYPCAEQDNCVRCAACVQACPKKAIAIKDKAVTFDYSECIACFCCQEVCPNRAIYTKKSLLSKLIGL